MTRPIDIVSHDQYLEAWAWTEQQFEDWYQASDLDVAYSLSAINDRDHGCPPPPAWLDQDDHSTGFDIDGRLVLWCEGARFDQYREGGYKNPRLLDQVIPQGQVIDVACMGTMFYFLFCVQLRLRQQGLLPKSTWGYRQAADFRNATALDLRRGHVDVAVLQGLASKVYTDHRLIAPGDLIGVLRKDGKIGHWCFAGYDQAHVVYDGAECVRTYGASPWAEGVGFDPYRKVTSKGRGWIGAAMYR